MKKRILSMFVAAALMFGASQQAMAQTKQAVVVGSSGNVTTVKDGTANAESTSGKTYVETTSSNTVTITTIDRTTESTPKVAKVTVRSYNVSSASDAKVHVTGLTVTGTGGATIVNKGSTLQMTATAAPTYADWKTVTWSITSGSEYASINETTGVLTGTAEGDVVVTATATDVSGVTGQCTVTVVKPVPAGAIRGKFTINADGEQVYFSQGNLQAVCTSADDNNTTQETFTWQFAANQWDCVGNNAANNSINGNGSVSSAGTVDLFGWSTAATTYGIHNSTTAGDYSGDFKDWGENIGPGWRTLTKDEWDYLFFTRASGSKVNNLATTNARYTHAIINTDNGTDGIKGMILFPDGVTVDYGDADWEGINENRNWNGCTKCTTSEWNALAAKGFVFLPTGGVRNGIVVSYPNNNGYYWSSTLSSDSYSYYTRVVSNVEPTTASDSRKIGISVRLVKNVVGSISYTTTSVNKEFNAAPFTNLLTNTGDGTVTYARSSGDDICTVNATTGEVTLNGDLGTCTITATVADGSIYTYPTNTTSYTLTVIDSTTPTGAIRGKFTVASGTQVYFSKGNLQATYYDENWDDGTPGTWSWAFAENQWDYIGDATKTPSGNGNISINGNGTVSANGTVDLFGWVGASSTWTGAAQYGITSSTATNNTNGYGNVKSENLKSDWGTLAITNGGNTENSGWRTLTSNEWTYLFNTRTTGGTVGSTAQARYTQATINTDGTSVNGMILFPDGVDIANTTDYFTSLGTVNSTSSWGTKCTSAQWTALAAKGCVFLPTTDYRYQASVNTVGAGYYWSSSHYTSSNENAYRVYFNDDTLATQVDDKRYNGYSVRLVKDAN